MAVYHQNNQICGDIFYPIGALIMWPSAIIPDGWLLADGSEYSSTEENGKYKALYDVIGTIYGVGSESMSFKVPDLRKRFVEGTSNSKILGTALNASIPSHNHTFTGTSVNSETVNLSHNHSAKVGGGRNSGDKKWPTDGYADGSGGGGSWVLYEALGDHTHKFTPSGTVENASKSSSIYGKSTTVQPAAVALNFIIRYK